MAKTSAGVSKMQTWIFQGNPDRYDIDGYLAARPAELLWLVTRYVTLPTSARAAKMVNDARKKVLQSDHNLLNHLGSK